LSGRGDKINKIFLRPGRLPPKSEASWHFTNLEACKLGGNLLVNSCGMMSRPTVVPAHRVGGHDTSLFDPRWHTCSQMETAFTPALVCTHLLESVDLAVRLHLVRCSPRSTMRALSGDQLNTHPLVPSGSWRPKRGAGVFDWFPGLWNDGVSLVFGITRGCLIVLPSDPPPGHIRNRSQRGGGYPIGLQGQKGPIEETPVRRPKGVRMQRHGIATRPPDFGRHRASSWHAPLSDVRHVVATDFVHKCVKRDPWHQPLLPIPVVARAGAAEESAGASGSCGAGVYG
jgi:hypothetical protein